MSEASAQGAQIVCFPEAYLPGLRGQDFDVPPFDAARAGAGARRRRAVGARAHGSRRSSGWRGRRTAGRQIAAYVIDARGRGPGVPDEEPDRSERGAVLRARERPARLRGRRGQVRRRDLPRGLALSRDGAMGGGAGREDRLSSRSSPGSDRDGTSPDRVGRRRRAVLREGDDDAQHREHDLLRERQLRAALPGVGDEPDRPVGTGARRTCRTAQEGVLVQAIDVEKATGLLAARYAPERHRDQAASVEETRAPSGGRAR